MQAEGRYRDSYSEERDREPRARGKCRTTCSSGESIGRYAMSGDFRISAEKKERARAKGSKEGWGSLVPNDMFRSEKE